MGEFKGANEKAAIPSTNPNILVSRGVGYDIKSYATNPQHERIVSTILSSLNPFSNPEEITSFINIKYPNSPISGEMVINSSIKHGVSPEVILSIMAADSSMGTKGKAVRTLNPGNVGNTDDGATRGFKSWEEGVDAVAKNLAGRKTKYFSNTPSITPSITPSVTPSIPEVDNSAFLADYKAQMEATKLQTVEAEKKLAENIKVQEAQNILLAKQEENTRKMNFLNDFNLEFVSMKRGAPVQNPEYSVAEDGGYFEDGGDNKGMIGMIKSKIAWEDAMGNPSAKRMVSPNPPTYTFTGKEGEPFYIQPPEGASGTHFMSNQDNSAVPLIQEGTNGLQYNINASPTDREAMHFNSPEEAAYFAEHYKEVAPMMRNLEDGGEPQDRKPIIVTDLNDPKLKAFQDSTKVYNSFLADDKFFSENAILKLRNRKGYYDGELVQNYNAREVEVKPTSYNNYNYPHGKFTADRASVPVYKEPIQPVVYQNSQQRHLITAKDWQDINTNNYGDEEIKVRNADTNKYDIYRIGNKFELVPKKPVQPVVYQPKPKVVKKEVPIIKQKDKIKEGIIEDDKYNETHDKLKKVIDPNNQWDLEMFKAPNGKMALRQKKETPITPVVPQQETITTPKTPIGSINIEGREVPYNSEAELKLFESYKPTQKGSSKDYTISRFNSSLYWQGDVLMDKKTGKKVFKLGGKVKN
jgi:hypothetical protein